MQDKNTANITQALKKINSRFELIAVAARRARQIQNYEAAVAKAESNYRNTSTLVLAQARVKNAKTGSKESKVEAQLRFLQRNPIQLFVDNTITKDKPTVVALREIQEGYVNRESLERQELLDQLQENKESYNEVDRLINSVSNDFDLEEFNNQKLDFKAFANEHASEEDDFDASDFFTIVPPEAEEAEDD
ncbi:DNA-directed RNA polymerase subunit omega [Psittacicella hinzii]|uniref:DNA-directed RNA polymerase subunit omega n=1 Tax=Psittacicella hinzii TaxID=2028575 RepID=A0A3A1YGA4_9GAMM|nr:DNA-directed RNA polymerase subunit omega [Psittacicella hinzii]RIY36486.1 DNA-directed RNA polymerase subunit omega [Psittacicella hinzii]